MATGTLTPTPYQTVLNANGDPVSGAKITTYVAGTLNAATTYSDVGLLTPNANPIVADSSGRYVAYLSPGASYKFVITTSLDVAIRTQDNISAVPAGSVNLDITGTAGETLAAGNAVYLSDGSGSKTAGSWYKADSANTYSSLTPEVGLVPAAITSGQSGTIRLSGQATGLSALVVGTTYYIGTAGALTSTPPTFRRALGMADTTSSLVLVPWQLQTPPIHNGLCQGRLTVTTGTPITASDVTAAGTIYFTPFNGNVISLYDGTATWTPRTFSELSIVLSGLVNAQGYDVFAYDNAGTVALETAEWKNATVTMTSANPTVVTWTAHGMTTGMSITFTTTGALPTNVVSNTQYWITTVDANTFKLSTSLATVAAGTFIDGTAGTQSGTHTAHHPQARQTAVTLQNGVYVKSGTTTRRLVGSFFTTGTTTTEDSVAKRYVSNVGVLNRVRRTLIFTLGTDSYSYSTDAFRQWEAVATNQVAVFVSLAETVIDLAASHNASNSTGGVSISIALAEDSTTTPSPTGIWQTTEAAAGIRASMSAALKKMPTVGYHAYVPIERSVATITTTWYGDNGGTRMQAGISGVIEN